MKKYIALIGNDCPATRALESHPLIEKVVVLPPDGAVDTPITSHPDTIMAVWNNKIYCHAGYYEKNATLLDSLGAEVITDEGERCGVYPYDCGFNALSAGDRLIARRASVAKPLRDEVVDTRQGYAACCGLFYMGRVITADESILLSARSAGLECVKVSGEDISLAGYDCGFVGGAAAALEDTLFIFGSEGKTAKELSEIAENLGGKAVFCAEGPLTDAGGVKFIETSLQK